MEYILGQAPVLACFDQQKELCDSREFGLEAVLLWDGWPLGYLSRTISDTETKYSQIRKTLLAGLFAFENDYVFTRDDRFLISLTTIMSKPCDIQEIILKKR